MKQKYYICKRLRLLEYLQNQGFEPVKTIPDATNPKYKWWLFEKNEKFEIKLQEYFTNLKVNIG